MGQNMLVFHNDSDSSYANYAGNLSSMSIAAEAVTLNFLGQGTSTAGVDSVVLSCDAGNEETVLEILASAAAESRSAMTVIADDKNSKYVDPLITGVTSISINTGSAHIKPVITLTDDRTLTVAESGSLVLLNHASKVITLPPAQAGLNFKVVFGIDTDAACSIVAAAGDAFYGNIKVISTTADNTEIQEVARATAVATPANFDNLDFDHDVTTLGGFAGDSVELICDSADAWHVNAVLGVEGDPGTIAVINAG
jgi:hypothetical protein